MICRNSNCGYKGKPIKKSRGSMIIGLILCALFIIPGILYFMLKAGYKYSCPECGLPVNSDRFLS